MKDIVPKLKVQAQHQSHLLDYFSKDRERLFSDDGTWLGKLAEKPPRISEYLSYVVPFLKTGKRGLVQQANTLIEQFVFESCKFSPIILAQAYLEYQPLLSKTAQERILAYLSENISHEVGPENDFVGVNDNFPAISTAFCLLHAKIFKRPDLETLVEARLTRYQVQLQRRGLPSEYNSPSYNFLQLHAMALIVEHAPQTKIRSLALSIEHRFWVDLLLHYYPATGEIAGPYSRAYAWDLEGPGLYRPLLYQVLGNKIGDPFKNLYKESVEAAIVSTVYRSCVTYHCPKNFQELAFKKKYPFYLEASTEGSSTKLDAVDSYKGQVLPFVYHPTPSSDMGLLEIPAYEAQASTYLCKAYSLGTVSKPFGSGQQCESFLVTWPSPDIKNPYTGKIYTRTIFNDLKPGVDQEVRGLSQYQSLVYENARNHCVQHQDTAILLSRPNAFAKSNTQSIANTLVIPNVFKATHPTLTKAPLVPIHDLLVGSTKVTINEGLNIEFKESSPVFINAGKAYFAFLPLIPRPLALKRAISITQANTSLVISFYSYDGEAREFAYNELFLLGGGFAFQGGSEKEYGDFANFKTQLQKVTMIDDYEKHFHGRNTSTRVTKVSFLKHTLALAYSPVSEGIKYSTLNDRIKPLEYFRATQFQKSCS